MLTQLIMSTMWVNSATQPEGHQLGQQIAHKESFFTVPTSNFV